MSLCAFPRASLRLSLPRRCGGEHDHDRSLLDLHALVRTENGVHVFRTAQVPIGDLAGRTLGFQQWWTAEALALVLDTKRRWERVAAPSPEDHEHCWLDSTTIETGVDDSMGWRSGNAWVCDDCFQRYFDEDILGLRTAS